jgi:hypothetical protein
MSPRELELALKKQRLQLQSAALRAHLAQQTRAFEPAAGAVDMVRLGYSFLRGRPYVWVAAAVVLVVAKPSAVWRWLKRGAVWWQAAQQMRGWAEQLKPVYDAWREASKRG